MDSLENTQCHITIVDSLENRPYLLAVQLRAHQGGHDRHQHGADGHVAGDLGEQTDEQTEHEDHDEAGQNPDEAELRADPVRQSGSLGGSVRRSCTGRRIDRSL